MPKQPEFTKYLPLDDWFRKQPSTKKQIKLTFDQVEAILGIPLPKSAIKLKNLVDKCPTQNPESSHSLAQQWLEGNGF